MSSHVLSGINELELKTCEQDIYTRMPTGVLWILINLINMYCLKVPETRHVEHHLWPVQGGGVHVRYYGASRKHGQLRQPISQYCQQWPKKYDITAEQ